MPKAQKKTDPNAGINDSPRGFRVGDRVKHNDKEHVLVDGDQDSGFKAYNRDDGNLSDIDPGAMALMALLAGLDDDDEDDADDEGMAD